MAADSALKSGPIRKILIIKPSALGDIVHTLPLLDALARSFPEAEIHWLVMKGLAPFLEGHHLIRRLWFFDRQGWGQPGRLSGSLREIWNLAVGLRRERFDVSLDLSGLFRSGLITWAAGARLRLGFAGADEGRFLFYNRTIPEDMSLHAVDRYLGFAGLLGCKTGEVRFPFAPYDPEPPVMAGLPERYAVLVPSAGKEANRWPAERFAGLAARLALSSVLIGSRDDAPICAEVVRLSKGKAIDLAGKTNLKELIPIIGKAEFVVTNDTGPMHIAAALKVPVYAIFGPANPARTGPYGQLNRVIMADLGCSPCYRWQPCEEWPCMREISVDRVLEVIGQGGAIHV